MKILAFTDSHGSQKNMEAVKKKAQEVDLVICCGDFTVFGSSIKKILEDINNLGKPVLLVHGNHEDYEEVDHLCKKFKNIKLVHKNFHIEKDVIFCGYGGGGFAQKDREFEEFSLEIASKKKNAHLVMIFHMPPHKTELDILPIGHVGSKSYSDFIKKHQPILAFCGHIEENNGKKDTIGKTIVINPGPTGKIITIESSILKA